MTTCLTRSHDAKSYTSGNMKSNVGVSNLLITLFFSKAIGFAMVGKVYISGTVTICHVAGPWLITRKISGMKIARLVKVNRLREA